MVVVGGGGRVRLLITSSGYIRDQIELQSRPTAATCRLPAAAARPPCAAAAGRPVTELFVSAGPPFRDVSGRRFGMLRCVILLQVILYPNRSGINFGANPIAGNFYTRSAPE